MKPQDQSHQHTTYRPYLELTCDQLPDIQQEVIQWLRDHTNFFEDQDRTCILRAVDYVDLGRSSPTLMAWLRDNGFVMQQIWACVMNEATRGGFPLHQDAPPLNFKINIPIMNTLDVHTEWYHIPTKALETCEIIENKHTGDAQWDLRPLEAHLQDYHCVARYNLDPCPIIFNSLIPHRVVAGPRAKIPRIMIACMFTPESQPWELMRLAS